MNLRTFLLMAFLGVALPLANRAEAAPRLTVDEPVWNVGFIVDKHGYEKILTLSNAGDAPLVIDSVEGCCGFYLDMAGPRELAPGGQTTLKLTISTFKLVGDLHAEGFIVSNDPEHPRFSVFAIGQVVPKEHSLAELESSVVDLGVANPGDRVPFTLSVRNTGNQPLKLLHVEQPGMITGLTPLPVVAPGGRSELRFEYRAERTGPIEERLLITSNDALSRTLSVQLKGYVSSSHRPDRALSIYPVGATVDYLPESRTFTYRITLDNQGTRAVELLKLESSLPVGGKEWPHRLEGGERYAASLTLAPKPEELPAKGFVYLLLAVPVEVR